ncbi:hypothetical protein SO802_019382 [Lithocarpus litseifolius]|uniref:PGG domain-containing protein n=1 Tax=Lithocarpus litseifolius TaxID=425828 RepID=A0AAW2CRF2_9ROSI
MSAYFIMGERIVKLNEVAQHGNIEAFYSLIIRENVRILEDIDEVPFVDTPLHIAASVGGSQHIKFAMEIMRLKPSFARKLNLNGYSPVHLALQEGHTQMVRRLLQVNADLVRVKGKEGRTPLHDVAAAAATEQQLDLLFKFLSVCPNSIKDVTIQNQTALHIALENNKLDAFKLLVGWLRKNKSGNTRELLNRQDEKGNTVLHVAAVSHLFAWGRKSWYVNYKNLEGNTALDILEGQRTQGVDNSEMRAILERAGALRASSLPTVTSSYARYLRLPETGLLPLGNIGQLLNFNMTDESRNALLVIAALLVTVTFQTAITPPGGLWQDNLFKSNTTDVPGRSPDDLYKLNITAPHVAG